MAITSYSTKRSGAVTAVTVTSSLSGAIYYFWYMDGVYLGSTSIPKYSIFLASNSQAQVECIDSNDPLFDPIANAPTGYSALREIQFVRSIDPSVRQYRIEQQAGGSGSWATIATISDDLAKWSFTHITSRLLDLTIYNFRIVPVDGIGNDGTILTMTQELIVRNPDAPKFKITFDAVNDQINFQAA